MFSKLEKLMEILGGIQILLGFWFCFSAIGIFIYCFSPNNLTFIAACILSLLGLILGIHLSIKAYQSKKGTVGTISKVSSTFPNED